MLRHGPNKAAVSSLSALHFHQRRNCNVERITQRKKMRKPVLSVLPRRKQARYGRTCRTFVTFRHCTKAGLPSAPSIFVEFFFALPVTLVARWRFSRAINAIYVYYMLHTLRNVSLCFWLCAHRRALISRDEPASSPVVEPPRVLPCQFASFHFVALEKYTTNFSAAKIHSRVARRRSRTGNHGACDITKGNEKMVFRARLYVVGKRDSYFTREF